MELSNDVHSLQGLHYQQMELLKDFYSPFDDLSPTFLAQSLPKRPLLSLAFQDEVLESQWTPHQYTRLEVHKLPLKYWLSPFVAGSQFVQGWWLMSLTGHLQINPSCPLMNAMVMA